MIILWYSQKSIGSLSQNLEHYSILSIISQLFSIYTLSFMTLFCFLGHNWGSEHDPQTDDCAPSGFHGGKYLMYPYAVSGYESNNKVSILTGRSTFV